MRNFLYLIFSAIIISCSSVKQEDSGRQFVKVNGNHFEVGNSPYYYVGANYWYGMNLGAEGKTGNRERLLRELDQLQEMGISNLRIMAITEGPGTEPFRIVPANQNKPGMLDENLMTGLDFLLAEMSKRKMYAVVCFSNFWPWSGGFAQYLVWSGKADSIPYPPPHPGGSWDTYQKFTAQFYSDTAAVNTYLTSVKNVVTRRNTITGISYTDDPTIMSWQLANEPRGMNNLDDYYKWIDTSASFIKHLDKNHLVTIGAEGYTSDAKYSGTDFIKTHDRKNIDYATAHVWVENWGWFDPIKTNETYDSAVFKMKKYIAAHVDGAAVFKKPVVLEEFGIARDKGSFDPSASVKLRDDYYRKVFEEVYKYASAKKFVVGVNYWAYAGEGRPSQPKTLWKPGDDFIGDPPHEFQGWYSVYNTDTSTINIIRNFAVKFSELK